MATNLKMLLQTIADLHSTDTKTKIGCGVITSGEFIWGVNHLAKDIPQTDIDNRTSVYYDAITHSEIHMCNKASELGISLKGTTVYVTLFPCDNCARRLIQEGVIKVIAYGDRPNADYIIRAKQLFVSNNVEFEIVEKGD